MIKWLYLLFLFPLSANTKIVSICDQFKRPFTLLALDAGYGEPALTIAAKYPQSTIILIDIDRGTDEKFASLLRDRCQKEQLSNVIVLNAKNHPDNLKNLAQSEHFDLVLYPRSLTHLAKKLGLSEKAAIDLCLKLAPYVLLGKEQVYSHSKSIITKHPLFVENASPIKLNHSQTHLSIKKNESIFGLPSLLFKPPGITLLTFQAMKGVWPNLEEIKALLNNPSLESSYSAAKPWDIIISGKQVNFMLSPSKEIAAPNIFSPSFWEIKEKLFECHSLQELKNFMESYYLE